VSYEDGRPTHADDEFPSPTSPYGAPPPEPRVYDAHPLFPRADGSPEDTDIRFISFLRRVDGTLKHCPEDIPAAEVQDWGQVTDWWGGGEYQAIAKTAKHVVIRHYPSKSEWVSLDGPPLPFVKRGARQAAVAHAVRAPESAPPAPAPAPPAMPPGVAELIGAVTKLADRMDRMQERMTTSAQQGSGNEVMVAMINAQASRDAAATQAQATIAAAEAKARADAQVAMANIQAENNKLLLGVLTKGGDGSDKLANLLGLLKPYLKPDAAPPPPPAPDAFAMLERAKELGLLGAAAAPSLAAEIKPIAETVGNVITQQIQADGKAKVAEAEVRRAEILAARAEAPAQRRDRDRDPPPLTYVEGLGMVHVVVAESTPPRVASARATVSPAPSAPVAPSLAAPPSAPAAPPVAPPPSVSVAPPAASPPSPVPSDAPRAGLGADPVPSGAARAGLGADPVPSGAARAGLGADPVPAELGPPAVAVPPAPPLQGAPAPPPQVAPPPQPELPRRPVSSDVLVEEIPPEVRSAIGAAAAEVTLEDKAHLAGMFGRLKELPVISRVPVIQKFFPAYDDKEATDLAKMVDELPMMQLWGLVDRLAPSEVRRITHLNGFNGPKA
jgi:hypothetical protein